MPTTPPASGDGSPFLSLLGLAAALAHRTNDLASHEPLTKTLQNDARTEAIRTERCVELADDLVGKARRNALDSGKVKNDLGLRMGRDEVADLDPNWTPGDTSCGACRLLKNGYPDVMLVRFVDDV